MAGTVVATVTGLLVGSAARLGLSRAAVLARAGLDEHQLADPDARVPFGAHMAVWEQLVAAAGERDLGLELGSSFHLGMLGVLGHALGQAPTLRDALPFYERCSALVSDRFMPRLREEGRRLVVERVAEPEFVRLRHPDELALAAALTLVRSLTGVSWPALAVRFQHPAPPSAARVSAWFGGPVEFGAPSSRLELDAAALSAPIRKSDPRLFEYLTRHAVSLVAQLRAATSATEQVRRAIVPLLREGLPREQQIARRLGLSDRTLQRRLEAEGTSFAAVVDGTRRELALLYLAEPRLAAAEVAYLLGYAEPSAFFRAFRRWTGATPRAWRRSASSRGAAAQPARP